MGTLTVQRLSDKEEHRNGRSTYLKWMIPLSSMVDFKCGSWVCASEVHTPIWPDPVPHIQDLMKLAESSEWVRSKQLDMG